MDANRVRPSMTTAASVGRIASGALVGGIVGFVAGMVWMRFAPDDGWGDLAAAAVTTVFLIPLGLVLGAVITWFRSRRSS